MGLFDKFKKDKKENEAVNTEAEQVSVVESKENAGIEAATDNTQESSVQENSMQQDDTQQNSAVAETSDDNAEKILLGVVDVFQMKDSEDLVVVGTLKGTLRVGEKVYVSNPGDDVERVSTLTVAMIENGPNSRVSEAKNCRVAVQLTKGKQHPFKIGSVVYFGNVSDKEMQETYIGALGDGYIMAKKMELSDGDIHRMSLTDCAEVWRLFAWFRSNHLKSQDDAEQEDTKRKTDMLGKALCEKVLSADEIYCVYNKRTGEPHLFSRTMKQNGKYACTPPDIMIFTEAYRPVMEPNFTNDMTEVKKIENGEGKDGIYGFLAEAIYLNGATGVMVLSEQVGIAAQMLVPEPNYADANPAEIPVENPDLMRWMLLMAQMPQPESDDQKVIYNIYYQFMAKEMVKARFLIPMKKDGEIPQPDENGKVKLEKDTQIGLATMPGKFDRDAVCMYTDWKRLRMAYDEEWDGLVQSMDGMIDVMDCAVNVTEYKDAGFYVAKKMYKEMKKLS